MKYLEMSWCVMKAMKCQECFNSKKKNVFSKFRISVSNSLYHILSFFRYQCPDQCDSGKVISSQPSYNAPVSTQDSYGSPQGQAQSSNQDSYGSPQGPVQTNQDSYGSPQGNIQSSYSGPSRKKREATTEDEVTETETEIDLEDVGVEKIIQVVSSGDLTFAIKESDNETVVDLYPPVTQSWAGEQGYICMSTPAFAATLVILLAILVISCLLSAFLCLRHRSYYGESGLIAAFANPVFAHKKGHF